MPEMGIVVKQGEQCCCWSSGQGLLLWVSTEAQGRGLNRSSYSQVFAMLESSNLNSSQAAAARTSRLSHM